MTRSHPPRNPRAAGVACLVAGLGALALATDGSVLARTSDRELPAEIDAGHWVDDPEAGYQVFSRGVTLVQGSLRVTADKATVYRGDGGFQRIVLEGSPAHWQEEMDDGSQLSAQAREIDYDVDADQVVLRREVVVVKERDEITGDLIRYDLATQKLDAGAEGDGRVRIRFTPTSQPDDS